MRSIQAELDLVRGTSAAVERRGLQAFGFRLENEGCLIIRSIIVGASPTDWILCFSVTNAWPSSNAP